MADLTIRLDWLTVTKVGGEKVTSLNRALYVANEVMDMIGVRHTEFPSPGRAAPHYQYNFKYADGLWVDVATNLDMQGLKVTISGIYLLGINTRAVIAAIVENDLKPTRVDVAIDIKNAGTTVIHFYDQYRKGHAGRKYVTSFVEGTTGATFYIGSRTSEKMVRIYDKAAEQGESGDWVRFELECKGDAAISALKSLYKADYGVFAGVIASMYAVPDSTLNSLFRDIIIPGDIKPEKPISDGLGWWVKSVIPALSKLHREMPDKYEIVISLIRENGHMLDN